MDGMFFSSDPEEIRAHMEAQQERARMEYEDQIHEMYRTIEEMKVDHLKMIRALLHNVGDTPQALGFWEGVIQSTITRRESVCPACGKDHDKEAARLAEEAAAEQTASREDPNVRGNRLIAMHEHNVEPVDDEDLWGKVRCTGIMDGLGSCGMEWPNLEDRQLREPTECSGCQIRSAHG